MSELYTVLCQGHPYLIRLAFLVLALAAFTSPVARSMVRRAGRRGKQAIEYAEQRVTRALGEVGL